VVGGLGENERCDEAQECEGFSKCESNEHILANNAICLGLSRDGLDSVTEDDTDADTGANCRETVTDSSQVSGNFCDEIEHLRFPSLSFPVDDPRGRASLLVLVT